MSMTDRDLADAIYAALTSEASVNHALECWRDHWDIADPRYRMWAVLAITAASAIDGVLARRQREAARTGPWDAP